ncbi:MAG: hypothetical protein ABIK12_03490 [Pseudomonadota bacterium]
MRNRFAAVIGVIISLCLLVSCAYRPPLQTTSGRPEVTIPGASPSEVSNWIANNVVNHGWNILRQADNMLIIGRNETNPFVAAVYGSRYNPTPMKKVTFNIFTVSGGVRVMATSQMVTNPGSGFESSTDTTSGDAHGLQTELEQFKVALAK